MWAGRKGAWRTHMKQMYHPLAGIANHSLTFPGVSLIPDHGRDWLDGKLVSLALVRLYVRRVDIF